MLSSGLLHVHLWYFSLGKFEMGMKNIPEGVIKQGTLPILSNTSTLFPGQGPAAKLEPSSVELARRCSQNWHKEGIFK